MNESNWVGEAVLPEGAPEGPKWSADAGGCEGINHEEATAVSALKISRNNQLSQLYYAMVPQSSFLSPMEEKERFLSKTEVIQAVTKSTRAWVKEFVVKYLLW